MITQKITIEDIKIYDIDIKFGETGYNIGDLLNMPFYWANWEQNPHAFPYIYELSKKTAQDNPSTILGKYYLLRENEEEKIPNLNRLCISIDKYIEDNNFKNNEIIKFLNDPNVLFVHVRSGDYGVISNQFKNIVLNLSKKFSKVILISGVNRSHHHTDENSEHNLFSRHNLLTSFNELLKLNSNIYIYLNEPDYHICCMRLCKNILIHRGGYSIIGSFVCNGIIYYTSELQCLKNDNWNKEMKYKNVVQLY